jgi:putative intracellular protease/amidase
MSAEAIDITNPDKPKRVAIVASNPFVSKQTGWAIGFWWAELTHPYYEFVEHGYKVDICSPDGGKLQGDAMSDPRDEVKLMADDLISLGFINSPPHSALLDNSKPLSQVKVNDYDAILFVGGEGPMYTFYDNDLVHKVVADFYKAGKITAVLCHGTCLLLKAKVDGKFLVTGKTWTGFANSEEEYADEFIHKRMQPFRIEDEAKKIPDTNFIVSGRFKSHTVRDGNLITGQQQYSAKAVARLMIEALGV